MASILDVANWFLAKEPLSPKKIQKLSYYYVAWGYALYERQLVQDDEFQAWIHGPVSPTLYQEFKEFGWKQVPINSEGTIEFENEELTLLESVWKTYGSLSANELEALTHQELPWMHARGGLPNIQNSNARIEPEHMHLYYKSIYAGAQGD